MIIQMIAALTIGAPTTIDAPTSLRIGDKAPALQYGAYTKGNPAQTFSGTRVTVVEFWATWCKPCIDFMPHLSDIWLKYKDKANFVSISVMENDFSQVKPFVERMGDKMAYPVAVDKIDSKGKGVMLRSWLDAAGQNSIPVAFIVDKSTKIAWIGHPNDLEKTLLKVINGTWDANTFRSKYEARIKDEAASAKLLADGYAKISGTVRTHDYIATLKWIEDNKSKYDGPETQSALDDFKTLFSAFARGDYETALEQAETDPKNGFVWTYFRPMLLIARIDALQCLNRNEWKSVVEQSIEKTADPNTLMSIVDALVMPESKIISKDVGLAIMAAEKLTMLARVPMFLVRLAWAFYANKDVEMAKEILREAFGKMDEEKKRNPGSYEKIMQSLKEAKNYFYGKN